MSKITKVKKGDYVQVVVSVWSENELPSVKNFYSGKVTEVVERAKHCFYVKLEGLDRLIPIDRARTV
mgnify:CR=1 FL=1